MDNLPPSSSPAPSSGPSSPCSSRVLDPFAAISTTRRTETWIPPSEALGAKKRRNRSPADSPNSSPIHRKRQRQTDYVHPSSPFGSGIFPTSSSPPAFGNITPPAYKSVVPRSPVRESLYEKEERIWSTAISQLVDEVGETGVELSNSGLTFISPEVASLANIVRLAPLSPPSPSVARTHSLPTNSPGPTRQIQRVSTTAISISNNAKPGMTPVQLYLSGNQIATLPSELFRVENLTVLALRNNRLKVLPPAIGALRNLSELLVGGNQLQFLPSEIEKLPLKSLNLHPNKWLECTEEKSAEKSILSLLETNFLVPSLAELCVRILLSFNSGSSKTVMDEMESSTANSVGTHYIKYFAATCKPTTVSNPRDLETSLMMDPLAPRKRPEENDPQYDLRYSVCPNKEHGVGVRKTFIAPAEIRYRWVKKIGAADTGGRVPLQYRGCGPGCLNFLEEMFGDSDVEEPGDDDFEF
ncbi:SubName: Full=Uncharacterized protein {ECO:0000313/EMBL:CCA70115.1} [Serendipita indica DSM 11827]|nr:SubName: Full=Uncharacterized protein {ECO:0000313/EMBL:CCA70115.1} [Serendipita indica DSM 11827]